MEEAKEIAEIIIKKQRQKQSDELIREMEMDERKQLFTSQLINILKEAGATIEDQQFIIQLFLFTNCSTNKQRSKISISKFQGLRKFDDEIKMIDEAQQLMQKEYQKKKKQCIVITQISQHKHLHLKVINIQYRKYFDRFDHLVLPYSVSAFELFKVVQINKLLITVVIKGVQVERFQQFAESIYPYSQKFKAASQRLDSDWLINFHPSNSLELTLNCKIYFDLSRNIQIVDRIKYFTYFGGLFKFISDFRVKIQLGLWWKIEGWSNNLWALWKLLKTIKQIHLSIQGTGLFYLSDDYVPIIRAAFYGGLASFSEISELSLKKNLPNLYGGDENFNLLAIKETLRTLFQNNQIDHLQLDECSNLYISPQINALEFITITKIFSTNCYDFLNEKASKLRYVKFNQCDLNLKISEELFNQLQVLIIINCLHMMIDVKTQRSSNIQHLSITTSKPKSGKFINTIFPKLRHLNYLNIEGFAFDPQLLLTIPSHNLENLQITRNKYITDKHLKKVDQNWQRLKFLKLCSCNKITINVWIICRFQKLIEIQLDYQLMLKSKKYLQRLKLRGIKLNYIL